MAAKKEEQNEEYARVKVFDSRDSLLTQEDNVPTVRTHLASRFTTMHRGSSGGHFFRLHGFSVERKELRAIEHDACSLFQKCFRYIINFLRNLINLILNEALTFDWRRARGGPVEWCGGSAWKKDYILNVTSFNFRQRRLLKTF